MEVLESQRAREVVRSLLKAKKAIRIYPVHNVLYRAAIDDVFAAFRAFLDTGQDLVLKIRSQEILFVDEVIYQSTEKRDNLALLFFKDGVRELIFRHDLGRGEIESFLALLSTDFERLEGAEDFLSAVWERNFENIKLTVDEIHFLESDDAMLGIDSIDARGGEMEPATPVSLSFGVGGSGGSGHGPGSGDDAASEEESGEKNADQLLQRSDEDSRLKRAYADSLADPEIVVVRQEDLSADELQLLVSEVRRSPEVQTEKLLDILFLILEGNATENDAAEAGRALKEMLRYALKKADFSTAVALSYRLDILLKSGGNAARQAEIIVAYRNSREVIDQIGHILDSTKEIDETALYGFTSLLGKEALIPFVDLLDKMSTISARRQINNILIQLGREDVQRLIVRLNEPLWFVVRNIIYVLRHIADPAALEPLIRIARHDHPRVRLEVVRALNDYKSVRGLEPLRLFLSDGDSTVRLTAVMVLGQLARETTGALEFARDVLMAAINDKAFDGREFREKKTFHEVLASIASPEVAQQMMAVLRKKTLFKSRTLSERKAAAAYLLGLAGTAEALPLLKGLRATSDLLVREHVLFALNRMGHA
jgi:HEAT repeat protein